MDFISGLHNAILKFKILFVLIPEEYEKKADNCIIKLHKKCTI